jgi:DNA-directed RNA polymerase subunit RPC12/RpoP
MAFMCPHCQSSFQTIPTEDPQLIPCEYCGKKVKIIKPSTYECPECKTQFPTILQASSKEMDCPGCKKTLYLIK